MGSTDRSDRSGRPEQRAPRRNTLQRMLDLEKINKVNRMQASSTAPPRTSTAPAGNSSHHQHLELHPPTLKSAGRAMTTPALALAIPPAKLSFNATTTKYIIRSDGDVVPQEEESEEDSDVSSICHSPGWEDSISKKRKKEKREARERKKKENAKAEADATKLEQKAKSRLSKAPPANKQLSKMAVPTDQSVSEPVVPIAETSPGVQEVKDGAKKETVGRARRRSLDIGLKSFIQVKNAIPVPWKSSLGTQVQTTPTEEMPPRTSLSKATGGFIGGLKLRQAEEATVQESIRKIRISFDDQARGLLDSDKDLAAKGQENLSSSTSIAESFRPTSIYEKSIRSPEQWDSIYAQAAALARSNGAPKDDDTTPIMERNIRKARKTHPPTSRYFPLANDPDSSSSKRDTSEASSSRTSAKSSQYSGDPQGRRESNVPSGQSDSIPGASEDRSEMTESNRGRTRISYIRHQRQQSKDGAVAGFQDQDKISEATKNSKARNRSDSSRTSRSRFRSSTDDITPTSRPTTGNSTGNVAGSESINASFNENYRPPPLSLVSSTFKHGRKRSNSAVRGLMELKNAARSAFTKHSATPDSPTESFVSANEFQGPTSLRPQSKRAATTGVTNEKPREPERILGGSISSSPIAQDFAPQNPLSQASNDGVPHRQSKVRARRKEPVPNKGVDCKASHSKSTTDSSEDYSLHNESSNITTSTASRPQSHKEYSPSSREFNSRAGKADGEKLVPNRFAMISGGVLDDAASGRESWCRTAVPIELTEDEDRMKTPTAKRSAADFIASQPELPKTSKTNLNTNPSDLHREPSLSRSISTPEMQDLSFLPELKHQTLARPPAGKGQGHLGKKGKQASVSKEQEGKSPRDLVRPPPISIPGTTKSEGSSPTLPQPSQYLQNARLNLPRSSRSPVKSGFPPAHLPNPQAGGSEPVAKMFVVCCSCKYFHDMPSKIYECMAKPDNVVRDTSLGVSGVISTSVKCPWCGHGMSTSCCAGYATVVYLREKLH